jgi:hypothetical protein
MNECVAQGAIRMNISSHATGVGLGLADGALAERHATPSTAF